MNISLSASVTGLDEDIAQIEARFRAAMKNAMPALKEEMSACLFEHVQGDVYEKFTPKEYVRRGEYGGLADIDANARFDVRDNGVRMIYLPSGESEQVAPEAQVDGDALIGRIENKRPDYDWRRKPSKRPFFTNFLGEMIEEGRAERAMVDGINAADGTLEVAADLFSTTRDGDEGFSD